MMTYKGNHQPRESYLAQSRIQQDKEKKNLLDGIEDQCRILPALQMKSRNLTTPLRPGVYPLVAIPPHLIVDKLQIDLRLCNQNPSLLCDLTYQPEEIHRIHWARAKASNE